MIRLVDLGRKRKERGGEVSMEALYEQIGRLKRDQEWLKKSERDWLSESIEVLRSLIDADSVD